MSPQTENPALAEHVNLIKLCVGADNIQSLLDWQTSGRSHSSDGFPRHVTRMWPKKENDILAGGSLYWVIKGQVLCRQRILRLDEVIGADGIRRCGIILDRPIIRTQAAPRRAFQGWRYLMPDDAPPDLPEGRDSDDALPEDLNRALAEIGVL